MGQAERTELGETLIAAADRFSSTKSLKATTRRLLNEYLALTDPSGRTLSGLCSPKVKQQQAAQPDLVAITRRWLGRHVIRHYFVMRQYKEASELVLSFLQFLRSDAKLPAKFVAEVDAAIEVAETGVEQLPHVLRITRFPDALNEAYAFRYQLRPWPLGHVPQTAQVRESSSRFWPANNEQHYQAWISFASERCRVQPDEMEQLLAQVPVKLSIVEKTEGCWEVKEVLPDNRIVFQEWRGTKQFTVPFSAKRAADFIPGFVMCASFVTLSDGRSFVTDWGYVAPTFYTPYLTSEEEMGARQCFELVY